MGRALDGVDVRIGEDGEILTRGPQVMLGYYKDEAATRQARTPNGWLHTGDLGRMDAEGNVTITGRRKEILVLSNGKNIACAALEQALERSPYIQHALVVGDGRKFVSVLIVAHLEHVARVARERGLAFDSLEELLLTPPVVALFREELSRCQAEFSSFEQAKRFCFLRRRSAARHRSGDSHFENPPLGARAQVRRLDRAYVPAGRSPGHPDDGANSRTSRQTIEAGSYKTS